MKNYIWSGVIGGLIVCFIGFMVFAIYSPINSAPIYMLNTNCITDSVQHQMLDSLKCMHMETLIDLEEKGLLLNPAEYSSHISSYYNGLIAFLIGIFVFFTISGIFAIRLTSKREFEELKQELTSATQDHIVAQLQRMISDSRSFQETTITALTGRIEDKIVTPDKLDEVENSLEEVMNKLTALEENMRTLYEYYNDIEDRSAASETISEE